MNKWVASSLVAFSIFASFSWAEVPRVPFKILCESPVLYVEVTGTTDAPASQAEHPYEVRMLNNTRDFAISAHAKIVDTYHEGSKADRPLTLDPPTSATLSWNSASAKGNNSRFELSGGDFQVFANLGSGHGGRFDFTMKAKEMIVEGAYHHAGRPAAMLEEAISLKVTRSRGTLPLPAKGAPSEDASFSCSKGQTYDGVHANTPAQACFDAYPVCTITVDGKGGEFFKVHSSQVPTP